MDQQSDVAEIVSIDGDHINDHRKNTLSPQEEVHNRTNEIFRPPQSYLTPAKDRRKSIDILTEGEPPPTPGSGLRNRKSLSSSDAGCNLSFSHEKNDSFDESQTSLNNTEVDEAQPQINEYQQRQQQQAEDAVLLTSFWQTYDNIIILSLFSIFGIVFRIFSSTWFRMELGVVFSEDSALGTNLPLNCCSCFLLGLLCSGRDAIGIVYSKAFGGSNPYGDGRGIFDIGRGAYRGVIDASRSGINRARGYGNIHQNLHDTNGTNDDGSVELGIRNTDDIAMNENARTDASSISNGLHHRSSQVKPIETIESRRRRPHNSTEHPCTDLSPISNESDGTSIAGLLGLNDEYRIRNRRNGEDDIREVQLRALTQMILASPSLVLFPAKKTEIDIFEHHENGNEVKNRKSAQGDLNLQLERHFEIGGIVDDDAEVINSEESAFSITDDRHKYTEKRNNEQHNEQYNEEQRTSSEKLKMNMTRIQRINFRHGWDLGTSADEMKHQILVGLRVGFCGAVSTWSSWNSAMISLLQRGKIGEALVGYSMGIQLGVVSYRFGQQLAIYIFIFRRRREVRRNEKRGYGFRTRITTDDTVNSNENGESNAETQPQRSNALSFPSIRVIVTLVLAVIIVVLFGSIFIFPQHQQFAISLLFTPFGCLGRYTIQQKYNKRLPGFPLGTFICNLLSVALSGSIGSFLAGNPGPEESIVLTSMIAGFAGSLSTFAGYISEVLALIDPIIFKFDGFAYAIITVIWGALIGFFSSQAKNWADEI